MNLKIIAFLISVFGFAWVFIQFGLFLQTHLTLGTDLQFWMLWSSFILNLGLLAYLLLAYLFGTRRNRSGNNPPPTPPTI